MRQIIVTYRNDHDKQSDNIYNTYKNDHYDLVTKSWKMILTTS